MDLEEYEQLDPFKSIDSPAGPVHFSTPNRATAWRVDTLFTKEPDTIAGKLRDLERKERIYSREEIEKGVVLNAAVMLHDPEKIPEPLVDRGHGRGIARTTTIPLR